MRSSTTPSRRDGFTLIELLVVISILAILAGLTMAGISRVRAGQHRATTESTVKKLQIGLNQQLTPSIEEATKRGNPAALALAGAIGDSDEDRIRSLLTYAFSKRDFPTNFVEAKMNIAGVIPPSSTFSQVALPTGLSQPEQAAALLYIIVHDKAARGTSIDSDTSFASAETVITDPLNNKTYKAYKDGYGTPIAFLRWYGATNLEMQNPPFVNLKDTNRDPFDRLSKLSQNPWPGLNWRTNSRTALNANSFIAIDFDGQNKVLTVISAGPDKIFGTGDDVFGYPLARLGAKGD